MLPKQVKFLSNCLEFPTIYNYCCMLLWLLAHIVEADSVKECMTCLGFESDMPINQSFCPFPTYGASFVWVSCEICFNQIETLDSNKTTTDEYLSRCNVNLSLFLSLSLTVIVISQNWQSLSLK